MDKDAGSNTEKMGVLVDGYLAECRADAPNVVISNRVKGEAEIQRLTWYSAESRPEYGAKKAALVSVSKMVSVPDSAPSAESTDALLYQLLIRILGPKGY